MLKARKIDHSKCANAVAIYDVFQRSYRVEASFIGASDFPPLKRHYMAIAKAESEFYGLYHEARLAAVIEVQQTQGQLDIHSLTVDPDYFRQGLADKLLNYVLSLPSVKSAVVETAVANTPAIKLYEKHGFVEFKRWTPDHGIEKLALSRT